MRSYDNDNEPGKDEIKPKSELGTSRPFERESHFAVALFENYDMNLKCGSTFSEGDERPYLSM